MKKTFWIILIAGLLILAGAFWFSGSSSEKIPQGNATEKSDSIVIESPTLNVAVENPMQITGKAKGNWFFEGSFPINVYDALGNRIGSGLASATEDWMSEDFVNFESTIKYDSPKTKYGTLVFMKDNPSDDPDNNDSMTLPIKFNN